jgi:rubrerythrin
MNILEFAKKKEQFSIDLYTELAGQSDNEGLKGIFLMLAEEEKKHYKLLSDMAREMPVEVLQSPPVLKNASSVFRKMKQDASKFVFPGSEAELYRKARQYEQESSEFYLQKAREVTEPGQRAAFKRLGDEEQRHFVLLDSICDFVSRPLSYLEDAEFSHLEDYVEESF